MCLLFVLIPTEYATIRQNYCSLCSKASTATHTISLIVQKYHTSCSMSVGAHTRKMIVNHFVIRRSTSVGTISWAWKVDSLANDQQKRHVSNSREFFRLFIARRQNELFFWRPSLVLFDRETIIYVRSPNSLIRSRLRFDPPDFINVSVCPFFYSCINTIQAVEPLDMISPIEQLIGLNVNDTRLSCYCSSDLYTYWRKKNGKQSALIMLLQTSCQWSTAMQNQHKTMTVELCDLYVKCERNLICLWNHWKLLRVCSNISIYLERLKLIIETRIPAYSGVSFSFSSKVNETNQNSSRFVYE